MLLGVLMASSNLYIDIVNQVNYLLYNSYLSCDLSTSCIILRLISDSPVGVLDLTRNGLTLMSMRARRVNACLYLVR